jgi:hypothetical protein
MQGGEIMSELITNNADVNTEEFPERVQGVYGLWYKKDENDIYYLDIEDEELDEDELYINPWGDAHARYLKEHKKVFYYSLITKGELRKYLAQISEDASNRYSLIVKQMADADPTITEELKETEQLTWVARMNNICSRAREIVNSELIYS